MPLPSRFTRVRRCFRQINGLHAPTSFLVFPLACLLVSWCVTSTAEPFPGTNKFQQVCCPVRSCCLWNCRQLCTRVPSDYCTSHVLSITRDRPLADLLSVHGQPQKGEGTCERGYSSGDEAVRKSRR
ncbi:uncharacterized protein CC84DRAFT_8346 [Paraphaeosphaeria sporulosa]|uniref:Uncharacterized protein n=1 Tax=Paraphaeosphaeria sporulosa TaxID=1460663 RepID=A0A177CUW6_9PLEO|nr:uncharacterized protein CC84DRAFT_8346 [Paraphaeosphaeria sporulosa]OAG11313.1 hypothetical protein CC84DRAFT_8346 [Paraphaeosphaeria sporulosa]